MLINIKVILWTGCYSHEMIALVQITIFPADIATVSHLWTVFWVPSVGMCGLTKQVSFPLSVWSSWSAFWSAFPHHCFLASQLCGWHRVQPMLSQRYERLPMQRVASSKKVLSIQAWCVFLARWVFTVSLKTVVWNRALGRLQSHCFLVLGVTVPFQLFMVPRKKADGVVCGKVVTLFLANCSRY